MGQEPSYRPSSEAFAAYFAGEISREEEQAIEQWVAKTEENSQELEQLRLVWQDMGALHQKQIQVDLGAAFQRVKQKRNPPERKSQFPFWSMAAVILLLITVSWWLWKPSLEPTVFIAQGVQEISLSDGSLVTLNDNAAITYQETFTEDERGLELKGEAFFSVEEDADRPFRIYAGQVTVTVLGTEFNVNATEKYVEVTVASGRVEVLSEHVSEILEKGRSIHINTESKSFTIGSHSNSGSEYYWVNRQLKFESLELEEVLTELETLFNIEIEVSDEAIYKCRLQASFDDQDLAEIIDIIALSQDLEVSVNGDQYLLTGEGCDN